MTKGKEGWTKLRCECGSTQFTNVLALLWREGGGVTSEPGGYECIQCRGYVDNATLVRMAMLDSKKRELQELEAQVRSDEGEAALASSPS